MHPTVYSECFCVRNHRPTKYCRVHHCSVVAPFRQMRFIFNRSTLSPNHPAFIIDALKLTKLATETTGVVQQSESRKTTVTTKIVSSTTSVQQQESSEVVETMTEESTVLKKDRKSKKVKKGKENISVVSSVGKEGSKGDDQHRREMRASD